MDEIERKPTHAKQVNKYTFVNTLTTNFLFFLEYFTAHCPFTKQGQLERHLETIRLRRDFGSAKRALQDKAYLKSLYQTLRAWGIGSRGSKLRQFDDFVAALTSTSLEISELDGLRLDQAGLDIEMVVRQVCILVDKMEIVENKAKLVPCSKTLHHILPDLIVPIDREYTQVFFGWQNPKFQYDQAICCYEAFKVFQQISKMINPSQYVGSGWNTSLTKVIDNAIVGIVLNLRSKYAGKEFS